MQQTEKTLAIELLREIFPPLGILVKQGETWVFRAQGVTGVPEFMKAVATKGYGTPDEAVRTLIDHYFSARNVTEMKAG